MRVVDAQRRRVLDQVLSAVLGVMAAQDRAELVQLGTYEPPAGGQ